MISLHMHYMHVHLIKSRVAPEGLDEVFPKLTRPAIQQVLRDAKDPPPQMLITRVLLQIPVPLFLVRPMMITLVLHGELYTRIRDLAATHKSAITITNVEI